MNYSQVTVDILQNPKYAGAIDSIKGLTNWIDSGFGMAITLVAFLIILVAMFKNVLAGAYCAYPKFWDRVDAAHKEVESIGWIQQFKDTFMTKDVNGGSFSNAIMRILPNIKSLTDFESDTVSPKSYFIRALPQMFLCIIIGAFIYNGHYRDAAAKVVDFGSEMIQRVLVEVDPIAVFDQFTGSAGRPVFASDGSEIPQQQLVNKISESTYNAVIGEYNDIDSSEAKRALATTIETKINTWIQELESIDPSYVDGTSWKPILQVSIVLGEVDISQINGKFNADKTVAQYALQFPVSDLNLGSNINVDKPMYVRIRLNLEKQATQTGNYAVTDLTLYMRAASANPNTPILTVPQGSKLLPKALSGDGVYKATGESGTISLRVERTGTEAKIYLVEVNGSTTGTFTLEGGGIPLDNSKGMSHAIKYISFEQNAGSGVMSSEKEGRNDITWSTEDLGIRTQGTATTPPPSTEEPEEE